VKNQFLLGGKSMNKCAFLIGLLFFFVLGNHLKANEKYLKEDMCVFTQNEFDLETLNTNSVDIDENDTLYVYNKNSNSVMTFSSCKLKSKILINNKFETIDVKMRARDNRLVIYQPNTNFSVAFVDLRTGDEKDLKHSNLFKPRKLTFRNGSLMDLKNGASVISSPYAENVKKFLPNYLNKYEVVDTFDEKETDKKSRIIILKGSNTKTDARYFEDFRFNNIQTVDDHGNLYVLYQKEIYGETSCFWPTKYENKLLKFDEKLKLLNSWDGDYFCVNEKTMDVYVFENMNSSIKIIKWKETKD
jgi:hypothetical protein